MLQAVGQFSLSQVQGPKWKMRSPNTMCKTVQEWNIEILLVKKNKIAS